MTILGYTYTQGDKLETFMEANEITSYKVGREALKEVKASYSLYVARQAEAVRKDTWVKSANIKAGQNKNGELTVRYTEVREAYPTPGNSLENEAILSYRRKVEDKAGKVIAATHSWQNRHEAAIRVAKAAQEKAMAEAVEKAAAEAEAKAAQNAEYSATLA
jgi:hypothetical protein